MMLSQLDHCYRRVKQQEAPDELHDVGLLAELIVFVLGDEVYRAKSFVVKQDQRPKEKPLVIGAANT